MKFPDENATERPGGLLAPYIQDERHFQIVSPDAKGVGWLRHLKRREFPPFAVHSWANSNLNQGFIDSFECFLTGAECQLVEPSLVDRNANAYPFSITREHLVCRRHSKLRAERCHMHVAGAYFNRKIGHIPLPMKILTRRHLDGCDFSRTSPDCDEILGAVIDFHDRFMLGGLYPWQPWTYSAGGRPSRAAAEIFGRMLAAEKDFLHSVSTTFQRNEWVKNMEFEI